MNRRLRCPGCLGVVIGIRGDVAHQRGSPNGAKAGDGAEPYHPGRSSAPSMARINALLTTLLAAALGACAGGVTPTPPGTTPNAELVRVDRHPQDVLTDLMRGALDGGYRIERETPDTIEIDLGVRRMAVPIVAEHPAMGRHTQVLETEVHGIATYQVFADGGGSMIAFRCRPTFFNPASGEWMPGPAGVAPGRALLLRVALPGVARAQDPPR